MTRIDLKNPGMDYRPVPFWSWNEKLDTEELRRQVREMHDAGIGGFFMHARGGLQTEYLSAEWIDCVCACLDEAGKLGMNAWLYDENGWPSGFGGGLVNGLGETYQQKYLRFETIDATAAGSAEHTIAFYTKDGVLLGRELPAGTTGEVLRAYYLINKYYVDNLDPKIVAEFIRVTHQHYYDTLPKELLPHLKGIFSDEPQLSRNGLLWSLVLEDEYRREYGRDLLNDLPSLAFDVADFAAIRVRFWRLCAKLFRDNFMKQIRDWCDAHGWWLTGHHVLEETCQSQLSSNGAIMPQYQYYNIPGIDHLCRSLPSPVMMTQIRSVAAQFGHKQILTESFALTGWNCNFTGQRWIYHPELAHDVNFLCQHLEGYSLRGLRKRDYPSSAFYHQPWWKDYRVMNDYFSRINEILAVGRKECSTLVVHPQSSAWMLYTGDERKPGMGFYTDGLRKLTVALDAMQIPHHYADELICEEHGSCEAGRITIGQCSYNVVIIPPVKNLSGKMHELLRVFQLGGGTVFRMANAQDGEALAIDGSPADPDTLSWFLSLPTFADEQTAAERIAELFPQRVIMTENGVPSTQMLSNWRDVDELEGRGGRVYLLVNQRYHESATVHVSLPKTGPQVEIIEAQTGNFRLLDKVVDKDGRLEFDLYFGGADAALLFVPISPLATAVAADCRTMATAPAVKQLDGVMKLAAADENILTLDNCRYRVDGGDWAACAIIDLQSRLITLKRDCNVDLEIPFQVGTDFDFNTSMTLAVETPWLFTFALNGVAFDNKDDGYKFDKAFRRVAMPKAFKVGENILSMSLRYHQQQTIYDKLEAAKKFETEYNTLTFETEIESVYLLGAFSVRHIGEVEALPREALRLNGAFELGGPLTGQNLEATELVTAGLPFFAGKATLEATVKLTAAEAAAVKALRFEPRGANSWAVAVNGVDCGTAFWEPYMVPVAGKLKEGNNVISFQLTTSLRNMLGPHHLADGESYAVHTMSFNREDNFANRRAPATVDGYCMVNLGVIKAELV